MNRRILCVLLSSILGLAICAAMPTDPPIAYLQVAASTPPPEVVVDAANLQPSPEEMALRVEEGTSLFLKGAVFDPIREAEPFAANRVATASPYRLVQFEAPLTLEERKALEAQGAEVLEYIPTNGYIVRINNSEGQLALSGHPGLRWMGAHRGGQKIAPMLSSKAWRQGLFVDVRLFRGENPFSIFEEMQKIDPSVALAAIYDRGLAGKLLRIFVPEGRLHPFIEQAAEIPGVLGLDPWFLPAVLNNNSIWVIQSYNTTAKLNYATSATLWNQGITGTGQTPAVCDSGLDSDMCFFRLSNAGAAVTNAQFPALPGTGTIEPTKKVIAYYVLPGSNEYDNNATCPGGTSSISWHGTHVSGSVVGDNYATLSTPTTGGHDAGDGMAPNAKLILQDAGDNAGCLSGLSNDNYLIYQQAYDAGARIHNNSWGSAAAGAYTADSEVVDQFMYDYEDFTLFFSNGNSGGTGTVGSPATAKNCVSVGATVNGSGGANTIATYSSRGPCTDGRRKPEICAPGSSVVSASGDTNHTSNNCATKTLSGTSMASPTAAGGATLLRQYFTDGFYPTGAKAAADALNPSSALMKAALVNGAVRYSLTTQAAMLDSLTLDFAGGYGRQVLDTVAYFTGDARRTRVWDRWNAVGLVTGQQDTFSVSVAAGQAFKVALAWTDPQASSGASVALVNNLDLEVVEPNGTTIYKGNVFATNPPPAQSTTGGTADALNNAEVVFRAAPTAGTWTIRVKATSVPGAPSKPDSVRQGYALVATYASCTNSPVLVAPTGFTATDNGSTGVNLAWSAVTGATSYQIYRATGNCSVSGSQFHYLGQTTGTTYTDTLAQGGFTYAYVVRAATTCSEGPASACATAIFTGNCDLKPSFSGVSGVVNDTATAGCDLVVSWPTGTSRCPLAPSVSYNIYRSTTPYFTPGVATRIVTGGTGTSYRDTAVSANTTYYYVVRIEDGTTTNGGPANGGNEDQNTALAMGTPTASTSSNGTWSDTGGDSTLARLTLTSPWRVTNRQNHTTGGSFSYHAGPDTGLYPPMTCAAATTAAITLQAGAPSLSYWVRYDLEYQWDGVVTEISTNGGGSWATITPTPAYPSTFALTTSPPVNACAYVTTQQCFTGPATNGALSAWTLYTHNLTSFAGQTVMIRWRFSSDPGLEFEGFYLDDIQITLAKVPDACTTCSAPGAPVVSAVNDVSACAQSGVQVVFTSGSGATSHDLYVDAVLAVTGYTSGTTYSPGDTASHNYLVKAISACGNTDSNTMAGTDADSTPGAPVVTGITDVDACVANGIQVTYTAGSGAVSHDLYKDAVLAVAGYVSGATYSPGDTASHDYAIQAINGTCTTDSSAMAGTDAVCAAPPEAAPGTGGVSTALTWSSKTVLDWPVAAGATSYNLYRGVLADLLNGNILNGTEDSCYRYQGAANQATGLSEDPAAVAGRFYWYLVTGVNGGGEGSAGPRWPNASTTCP